MKKLLSILFLFFSFINLGFVFSESRFDDDMLNSVSEVEAMETWIVAGVWADSARDFVIWIAQKALIPLMIIVWIIIAIIWWYKLMFSNKDDEQKKWMNFFIWWVVGIFLMVSAWYIVKTLVWDSWSSSGAEVMNFSNLNWVEVAEKLYTTIAFPFIKLLMFIIVWVLFIMLLINVMKFLMAASWDVRKQALNIITWNTIWIIFIIAAEEIVELVYWSKEKVLNTNATNIWAIGEWVLTARNVSIAYNIINRFLWIVFLIMLVIIIYQWYLLLVRPDREENIKSIRKTITYMLIWILIIGAWYLITNFLLIK